eukprot:m.25544 g.25544  ORF g.25544 m.25544 type:complete len:84 (-) comp5775_c0_seq1:238-489(-)
MRDPTTTQSLHQTRRGKSVLAARQLQPLCGETLAARFLCATPVVSDTKNTARSVATVTMFHANKNVTSHVAKSATNLRKNRMN